MFLLSVLVLQPGVMLLFYRFQQCYRKFEMQEVMQHTNTRFQKISLSISEFNKCKVDDSEISISGERYDIRDREIDGDTIELLVIRDKEEENILKRIFNSTHHSQPFNSDFSNQIKELLSLNYLASEFFRLPIVPENETTAFNIADPKVVSGFLKNIAPPPWCSL